MVGVHTALLSLGVDELVVRVRYLYILLFSPSQTQS